MSGIPELRTARLKLAPFGERHLTAEYVRWLNDRDLMRYSEQRHKVHTIETCRQYMQSFEGTSNCFWAIEEVGAGLGHIGNINSYVDSRHRVADIGIVIGDARAAKHGFGLEAWTAVCDFLFDVVGIRKITAGTMALNTAMIRLALSAGMTEDGVRKRHYLYEEQEVDVVHFALFATDRRLQD